MFLCCLNAQIRKTILIIRIIRLARVIENILEDHGRYSSVFYRISLKNVNKFSIDR